MASSDDNKAELEGHSLLSEGDENASTKNKKAGMRARTTRGQQLYGWFCVKNKTVERSTEMDTNGDNK